MRLTLPARGTPDEADAGARARRVALVVGAALLCGVAIAVALRARRRRTAGRAPAPATAPSAPAMPAPAGEPAPLFVEPPSAVGLPGPGGAAALEAAVAPVAVPEARARGRVGRVLRSRATIAAAVVIVAALVTAWVVKAHRDAERPTQARGSVAPVAGGWVEFSSTDGRFAVTAPSAPEEVVGTDHRFAAPLPYHRFLFRGNSGITYRLTYYDIPSAPRTEAQISNVVDSFRDGFVQEIHAGDVVVSRVSVSGFTCDDVQIGAPRRGGRARFCLARQRVYEIEVTYPDALSGLPDAERFVTSFRLLGVPQTS